MHRKYVVEYNHDGQQWGATIMATSFEDAERRLRTMCFGRVLGTLEMEIPALPAMGLFARLACWIGNAWRLTLGTEPERRR